MTRKRKVLVGGAAALALAGGGVGVAQALGGEGEEAEQTVTGPQAQRVRAAALKLVPGTAGSVERDDEQGAVWEVEVRRPDGSTVDVRLDADLQKVAVDQDTEGEEDEG